MRQQRQGASVATARFSTLGRQVARSGWGLLLVALATALFSDPASAQLDRSPRAGRSFHIGLGGGVSVPAGDLGQAMKSGFNGQGFMSWQPMGLPIGVRATFGYERFDFKPITPGVPQDGAGKILSGLANMTFGFPMGPVRPYLTAGLGAFRMDSDSPSTGTDSKSKTNFGIDGGAGLELRLGPLSAYVEGRLANVFTDQGLNPDLSTKEGFAAQTIPVTFGLVY
jgi:opacity protein-like surface antigen